MVEMMTMSGHAADRACGVDVIVVTTPNVSEVTSA